MKPSTEYQRTIVGLIEQLDLPLGTRLIITNEETGAGYVCSGINCINDIVLARWSDYHEGIYVLKGYVAAYEQFPRE